MGSATGAVLDLMGMQVYRVEPVADVVLTVQGVVDFAFGSEQSVAVLLSQRLLGRKKW